MASPVVAFGAGFVIIMATSYLQVDMNWKSEFYLVLLVMIVYEFGILARANEANIIRQVRGFVVGGVIVTCMLLAMFILAAFTRAGMP